MLLNAGARKFCSHLLVNLGSFLRYAGSIDNTGTMRGSAGWFSHFRVTSRSPGYAPSSIIQDCSHHRCAEKTRAIEVHPKLEDPTEQPRIRDDQAMFVDLDVACEVAIHRLVSIPTRIQAGVALAIGRYLKAW